MFFVAIISYGQDIDNYTRFVDSADYHIDYSSVKALTFLDSIPSPVEEYIEGRLADYYVIKGLVHDDYNEMAQVYKNYILAYKYAEKEENYITAGKVCLELCASVYFAKRDSTANIYLEKAKTYFEKADYSNGQVEVNQMKGYLKFLDGEYETCNALLLDNLASYKAVKDNVYYEMFAEYMLISNYIYLEDFQKAHLYYNDFERFKGDSTISDYNFFSFKTTIDVCFADKFLENKNIDSTQFYLDRSSKDRSYMGGDTVENYFSIYADYYRLKGDLNKSKAYLDSLSWFQGKMYNNIVDVSLTVNEELLKVENELISSDEKHFFERFWILILVCALILISVLFYLNSRKTKKKVSEYEKKNSEFSNLKSNNEKLKLKVHSLEEYINELKTEVKLISSIDELEKQRQKIKELYNNVHLNSSTILSKDESHLDLIRQLNVNFFERISSLFPQLSDSEIIICYYSFSDFKNKEIAVFLGCSVRAIESKRYRISKKLNTKEEGLTLYGFLNDRFGDLKSI